MLTKDSQGLYVRIEEKNEVGAITKAIYMVDGEPVDEEELEYINLHRLRIITSRFKTAD